MLHQQKEMSPLNVIYHDKLTNHVSKILAMVFVSQYLDHYSTVTTS